jgi:head-tail adaptor
MLTTNGLVWMRVMQERAMPGTVVIQRQTRTRDSMGGFTETWAAVGTALARIYPQDNQRSEFVAGDRVAAETRWNATFPVGTDVSAEDRLLYQSRTWEVVGVNNDEMWQTAVRCECIALNEENRI